MWLTGTGLRLFHAIDLGCCRFKAGPAGHGATVPAARECRVSGREHFTACGTAHALHAPVGAVICQIAAELNCVWCALW